MNNAEISSVFNRIAALLEVKSENPFKIRAYQKVAHMIAGFEKPLSDIYREGGRKALMAFPGIGEGTAGKIEQLLTTGSCRQFEELRASLPDGIEELLEVPFLGPKTAIRLARELKITNISALEKAIRHGRLKSLPRMGAKRVERILGGIEVLRRGQGRILLGKAIALAEDLAAALKPLPGVLKVVPAGSLRRMKETVGDLDLLLALQRPQNAAKVMKVFTTLPGVATILSRGNKKSSVLLKAGPQADLRIVPVKSFGAALHYFTGSRTHNIQIRELAVKNRLKINEYGIFRGRNRVGGTVEEDVFRSLDLPPIPPEIREGTGEVEAARAGSLPRLLTARDIRGDLHVHTSASDGAHSLARMAAAAAEIGLEYIAICDHSQSLKMAGGLSVTALRRRNREIDRINARGELPYLLKGAEVDILADGRLDYPDEVLEELDVVVAAIHTRFNLTEEQQTGRAVRALANRYVTMLAHPTGRLLGRREAYPISLDEVIRAARKNNKSLELNSQIDRLDLSDMGLRKAREAGVMISINSDAHHSDQIKAILSLGVAQARRGWLTANGVMNTLSLKNLRRRLARTRA